MIKQTRLTTNKKFLNFSHPNGIFAFLHNVLYIAKPKIIDAKVANGTKRKKLVLRPIKIENKHDYKVVTVSNQL